MIALRSAPLTKPGARDRAPLYRAGRASHGNGPLRNHYPAEERRRIAAIPRGPA